MRRILVCLIAVLVATPACTRNKREAATPTAKPSPTAANPWLPDPQLRGAASPVARDLVGFVLLASSGRGGTPAASPTPGESPGATASPRVTATPRKTSKPSPTPSAGPTAGSGGLLVVRVSSPPDEAGDCELRAGDVATVMWTDRTEFQPASLAENRNFPQNLVRVNVQVTGRLDRLKGGPCVFVAERLRLAPGVSPSPSGSPGATRSPKPTGSPKATPTASPSPSATPTATP